MFTYKNISYKILALSPKYCWADPTLGASLVWIFGGSSLVQSLINETLPPFELGQFLIFRG